MTATCLAIPTRLLAPPVSRQGSSPLLPSTLRPWKTPVPLPEAEWPGRPRPAPQAPPTFNSFSFLRRHSSHSLAMRPHRIHVSSSRWLRLEEAEELDTSEEPLFRREPFMERMDLESASRSLGREGWWRRAQPAGTSWPSPWSLETPWGQGAAGEPGCSSQGARRQPGIGSKLFLPVTLAGALNSLSCVLIPGPLESLPSECSILCLALG